MEQPSTSSPAAKTRDGVSGPGAWMAGAFTAAGEDLADWAADLLCLCFECFAPRPLPCFRARFLYDLRFTESCSLASLYCGLASDA